MNASIFHGPASHCSLLRRGVPIDTQLLCTYIFTSFIYILNNPGNYVKSNDRQTLHCIAYAGSVNCFITLCLHYMLCYIA